MAMLLVGATSIMVVGVLHGLTTAKVANEQASIDSELVYAAIGFAHLLRTDMLDNGQIGSTLGVYDLDGNNPQVFVLETAWENREITNTNLQYRILNTVSGLLENPPVILLPGEQQLRVRASREFNSFTSTVEVSVVIQQQDMPFIGNFFGNNLAISNGLTTKSEMYITNNVTGSVSLLDLLLNKVKHEGAVYAGGNYLGGLDLSSLPVLKNLINPNASVPNVDFDMQAMIDSLGDLRMEVSRNDSVLPAAGPGAGATGSGAMKAVRLRFDGDKVYASTAVANSINAVSTFGSEKDVTADFVQTQANGDKIFVLDLQDFTYVVVEGTYNFPGTVISQNGPIMIAGNLTAAPGVSPIGLVAADGDVLVRQKRPGGPDYGFNRGSSVSGEIHAQIYASGKLDSFSLGATSKMSEIEFVGSVVAQSGGTDLGAIANNRVFDMPPAGLPPAPGMEHIKASGGGKATFKAGSWGFNFSP